MQHSFLVVVGTEAAVTRLGILLYFEIATYFTSLPRVLSFSGKRGIVVAYTETPHSHWGLCERILVVNVDFWACWRGRHPFLILLCSLHQVNCGVQ